MESNSFAVDKDDARLARDLFVESADITSGWKLYDSAVDHFGTQYFESLIDSISYRGQHSELLRPYSLEEAEGRVKMYEHMLPRVLLARQVLEKKYPELLELWLKPDADVIAFTDVLAEVIAAHPTYKLAFQDCDIEAYVDDCHSSVQWLRGWLVSAVNEEYSGRQ